MENILLHEKAWTYKLYKNGSDYVLSVPCGSSALYEVDIPIGQEVAEAGLHDPALLELLATSIQQDPNAHLSHSISLN